MTYITYTNTGPFVNGGAPGISASFLNALETFCHAGWFDSQITSDTNGDLTAVGFVVNGGAMGVNTTPVVAAGSVSGTASLYEYFNGAVKRCLLFLNNYKSAAAQSLTLPTAFTNFSYWIVSELQAGGQVEGLLGGGAQTFSVLTALALAGGTQNPQASLKSWSQGMLRSAFDTLRVTQTATATTGLILIEGL